MTPLIKLNASSPHESARKHVSGAARYVDDLPAPQGMLHGFAVASPHAHAKIVSRDGTRARALPGVHAVLFAADVPGSNHIGPVVHDEDLLADATAQCVGHAVAVVVAESRDIAREAAALVDVVYEVLPAILTIEESIAAKAFLGSPHHMARGDVDAALASAAIVIKATARNPAQDHFYLETHAALAIPEEGGNWLIYSSTQHPTEVQGEVASVLGLPRNAVVVEVPRLGGGFGGKESQASQIACWAALGAHVTGRPVKVWLDREQDMTHTGKRHPFRTDYEAGFDADGRLTALRARVYADAGFSLDLSQAINDRALFHLDNAYYVPNVDFQNFTCKTNLLSNTAFRGFGGPQGMVVIEDAMQRAAERLGKDPNVFRVASFYGDAPRNVTPYGMRVDQPRAARLWEELSASSDYATRSAAIAAHNATSSVVKRGLGFMPVKFGISFTATLLNQAGALVLVYADGSVQMNHGGIEMGQGLHTKMLAIAGDELGVPASAVRAMDTATDKVPNTSATAASSGSDLNGWAVRNACAEIRQRMAVVAAEVLGVPAAALVFADGQVGAPGGPSMPFAKLANTCWVRRISLSSTGFYATPDLAYDREKGFGRPFFYFAWGASVVEVEVNALTGEHRVVRADLLQDVGKSLVPSIDLGQVEGAFVQGVGWLTMEECLYDKRGRFVTHGPSTYKIPTIGDVPADLRVHLLENVEQDGTIHGSKAVGEPPLMLGIGVVSALRQAIGAFASPGHEIELALPATPEAVLRAIMDVRARSAAGAPSLHG